MNRLPQPGDKLVVCVHRNIVAKTKVITCVYGVIQWRLESDELRIADSIGFVSVAHEGVEWACGWDGPEAEALRVATALL